MGMFSKARPAGAARVLPNHIGVIMDGNGRWAKKRGLPRRMGHSKGAKTFKEICRYCNKIGIKYLTAYAFSTENWKRPREEVDAIMELLKEYLQDAHNYKDENIKTRFIGDRSALSDELVRLMEDAERESADATGMTLNIAINYGGRDEIVRAARSLAEQVKSGSLQPFEIDEAMLSSQMYTAGQDDPDLIIRPSGEYRTSNFLLWQSAYAEYIFMDILWPDFTPRQLERALAEYAGRNRRFGGV
ncbi:MAG: isoprenyl transferase [Oscillospiraceae bacterium]